MPNLKNVIQSHNAKILSQTKTNNTRQKKNMQLQTSKRMPTTGQLSTKHSCLQDNCQHRNRNKIIHRQHRRVIQTTLLPTQIRHEPTTQQIKNKANTTHMELQTSKQKLHYKMGNIEQVHKIQAREKDMRPLHNRKTTNTQTPQT